MKATLPLVLLGASALLVALSIPMIARIVPRNHWYGFRTPKTLSSDERWYEANWFAGWALLAAGALSGVCDLLIALLAERLSDGAVATSSALALLLPVLAATGASVIYLTRVP
jgi:uncharacterized membrane protein